MNENLPIQVNTLTSCLFIPKYREKKLDSKLHNDERAQTYPMNWYTLNHAFKPKISYAKAFESFNYFSKEFKIIKEG